MSLHEHPITVVAGGAGFIGAHLCRKLLDRGAHVLCIDNFDTGREVNIADLRPDGRFSVLARDISELAELPGRIVRIFNLASPASPPHYQRDPVRTLMTNVLGTGNLLALARAHGARYVQASTSEVYGDPDRHPQSEDYLGRVNCTGPRACYDEGKRAAEALCFDHVRVAGIDVRVARIFNTYGPGMRADDGRIVTTFLVQALRGEPITVFGSGEQTRSFCYVDDLVEGLVRLMEVDTAPEGPVNLGNSDERSVRELAECVIALTGSKSRLAFRPLPEDDPRCRCPDISRARTHLGWRPVVPLDDGLLRTARWLARELGAAPAARRPVDAAE
ncbi:UDP-glucuronic acid decarboxylase family protein [Roseivivax isoporae]|uniref:NAD-dependent dehydratase n=1 Tax=Roseivivax isoporae LMG 25204 TaxID=1449351 RepID=X7FA97_9RHOB|nr:UDP-glucuronic acid decarboxylase family protein [Roseivivax isoporae]ETX29006.1 NAD-dependent dehydratase [Roseivivax isoporae LMG 25204]